ncbi:class I SAM-dependent methyltransferase [Roseinatronobacter alkalisoli]|uniref:Class I SAM-dependent methyltransferase n=1 Tax=Roseinatronobacter alkalisoli TaxID=3028235 RepID=A0ABT5TDA1_9RHOB|nr:class I SAM-dependent methyltransferase [Roseinatronobacter sp. HJB301]MDD7973110.1 class I SAM-dependent methyltransferase [Roseinatronobacter sp. HJB301]
MTEMPPLTNHSVKDRIRDYWSFRAATFDNDPGHAIEPVREAPLWQALITRTLGPVKGKQVLDLASGTGEISRQLLDLGADVTGVDFSEEMMHRAREKHAGRRWQGVLDDAEILASQPDAHFDAIMTRHLVWTLPDPDGAFRTWYRVLKPGGRILLVDGDWRSNGFPRNMLRALADWLEPGKDRPNARADYGDIMDHVKYGKGVDAMLLADDLAAAGFTGIRTYSLRDIYWRGMGHAPWPRRLRLMASRKFAMVAQRPLTKQ